MRALFLAPIAFAAIYGVTDEIHQAFVPTRSADPWDLLADAAGATMVVGAYIAWIVRLARATATPGAGNSARSTGH